MHYIYIHLYIYMYIYSKYYLRIWKVWNFWKFLKIGFKGFHFLVAEQIKVLYKPENNDEIPIFDNFPELFSRMFVMSPFFVSLLNVVNSHLKMIKNILLLRNYNDVTVVNPAYLGPCEISRIEPFWENRFLVNNYNKKSSSWIFHRINTIYLMLTWIRLFWLDWSRTLCQTEIWAKLFV